MRVSIIQFARQDQSKEEAVRTALHLLRKAPASDLLVLPEIWATGFFTFNQYQVDAEQVDGPLVDAFRSAAAERGSFLLMGSFIEKNGPKLFNSSLLIDATGRIVARYRKIHLFGYQSLERDLLTPGTEVVVADTPWGRAGIATCYDLRFPELFRKMIDLGAEFFLVASAWPMPRLDAWILLNRARACENLAYLIACNCAGIDAGNRYAGHSLVVDPLGRVVAEGSVGQDVVSVELDMSLIGSVRKDFSALRDRVLK